MRVVCRPNAGEECAFCISLLQCEWRDCYTGIPAMVTGSQSACRDAVQNVRSILQRSQKISA